MTGELGGITKRTPLTITAPDIQPVLLRHAFTFVDRVIFLIGPENYRSQRAVEKIGAARAGTRIDGYGRERLSFEITAAMFDQHNRVTG